MTDRVDHPAPALDRLTDQVILASAGSGKTYALSSRWLRIAAMGVDPTRILASTFTRAAAGEIRDRILARAAKAAANPKACLELANAIEIPFDDAAARALLRRLVDAWGKFQISTLDSVMMRIVTTHALDLGLRPGLTMADELEQPQMRAAVIAELLEDKPQRTLSLLKELTAGAAEANVLRLLDTLCAGMTALSHEATDDAWSFVRERKSPIDVDAAIGELAEYVVRAGEMSLDKRVVSALDTHLDAARSGNWEQLVAGGLGGKIIDGDPDYYRKPIPIEIVELLEPLVRHACITLTAVVARRTRASGELVRAYADRWRARISEDGALTFGDLPVLVRELSADVDGLAERLGDLPEHLLLDEMQDTSVAQWEALAPLVQAARDGGGTVFAVGDVKQSIYGWRGGVADLLASLPERFGVEQTSFVTTYRCRPAVVAAVNAFFGDVGAPDPVATDDRRSGACGLRRFQNRFEAHVAHHDELSFTWIMEPALRSGAAVDRAQRPTLIDDALIAVVGRIAAQAPKATIGVLVRRNSVVAHLMHVLGPSGAGFDVSARGGTPLIDAPPVEVVASALRLAQHPDDTVAAFHVARSPLGAALRIGPEGWNSPFERRRSSAELRARILRDGLAATVRHLVTEAARHADPREQRRLVALAEMATRGDGDPTTLLTRIESEAIDDESPARIRIMNIHQSKGLDFDFVVLPELEGALVRKSGMLAAERRRANDHRIDAIVRWVNDAQQRALPDDVRDVFDEHRARFEFEAMCAFYVAMTRARHGLIAIVPPALSGDSKRSPATLLRSHLAQGRDDTVLSLAMARVGDGPGAGPGVGARTLHRDLRLPPRASGGVGDDAGVLDAIDSVVRWVDRAGAHEEVRDARALRAPELDPAQPASIAPSRRSPRSAARPPSSSAARTLGDALGGALTARSDATDAGTAWHSVLEHVEWIDDFEAGGPDDATLVAAIASRLRDRDAEWCAGCVAAARAALKRPNLRALLTAGDRAALVRRERPFVRRTSDGIQRGTIDRLVLTRSADGSTFVGARIIDFKTGDAVGSDAELADRYRAQLAAYADAVAEMFRIPKKSIRTTLAFVESDRVVDMGG